MAALHASGKLVWKAKMRFAIGNVVDAGATWLITSQDGAQQATIDARTGKLLRIDKLKARPAAGNGEVF